MKRFIRVFCNNPQKAKTVRNGFRISLVLWTTLQSAESVEATERIFSGERSLLEMDEDMDETVLINVLKNYGLVVERVLTE